MRIVFMGTPEFASVSLAELIGCGYEIAGVFTQPDKAKGRGMELSFSPVKELALDHGIPVFQPEKMRDGTALRMLKSLDPDLVVVVAYGRILPDDLLEVPPLGIQWSVLNGEETTGVSTMYLASEMDAGDVILTDETEIGLYETSGELYERLSRMGADLLVKTLEMIEKGIAPRIPQDHSKATYAPMLDKSLCPIDFRKPARAVIKWIYGLQPWPVATAELGGTVLKVFSAKLTGNAADCHPGTVTATGTEGIEIACGDGQTVLITELQAPGKKRMPAVDYLRGHPLK